MRRALPLLLSLAAVAATAQPAPRGVIVADLDKKVAPGADFFQYANGRWLEKTEIPADRAAWGVFQELREQTLTRTRALMEESAKAAPGTPARKVGDFYASFMDEAAIEKQGARPLAPVLKKIAAIKDRRALARRLGEELRADVDPLNMTDFYTSRLFGLWVSPDFHEDRNAAYLMQGGLGLPDREYYVGEEPKMVELRTAYLAHIARMFTLAGMKDGEARAKRVLALETEIARSHASREESADVRKADNPWKRADYGKQAPGMDWNAFFAAAGLGKADVVVAWHPGAIKGAALLVEKHPLDGWRDWLAFHAIDRAAPWLSKAFVDASFDFHEKTMAGTPQLSERWKRGVELTNAALEDAVGKLYVDKHFPPAAKAQLKEMVANLVTAFDKRIDQVAWMDPATRARAKGKLKTLYVGVGYPESWTDFGALKIVRGDVLGNHERAELFAYREAVARLGKKIDMTEWWMAPQTVNALNIPLQNALNFPAAILAPPFFDPEAPSAANYGAIGGVIGHEIVHSFDDTGAQFDEKGKLADWWTKEDRAQFEAAGARLVAQYDAYRPLPDAKLNGKLTLGENIADLAGLAASYDAWKLSLGGKPAPTVGGLTGDQQFFLAWAQAWRSKYREPALRRYLIVNGHSPGKYRAFTVRNFEAWYAAFGVKPGQGMYLAPKDRVKIW